MDRINVFISYSSEEKKVAGRLKIFLRLYCGYSVFLAHEDIPGSAIWENEIIIAIKNSDFFIPLISQNFKNSDFTDQETGAAVSLTKKIFPIKLGQLNPYGFINKYHALKYRINDNNLPFTYNKEPDNIKELALTIGKLGLYYETASLYHKKSLNSAVYALCNSKSFDTSNAAIQLLGKCVDLEKHHLVQIREAMEINNQITGAYGFEDLKNLISRFNIS